MYGTDKYNDFFTQQLEELLTQYGQVDEVWSDGAKGGNVTQEYDFNRWYALIRKLQPQAVIAIMGPDVRWVGTETGVGRVQEWSVIPSKENMLQEIAEESQKEEKAAPIQDRRAQVLGDRPKLMQAKSLLWYPAETDVSIRPGWFYHANQDNKVKSPVSLMNIYFTSVGRNGVLLLNVPPNPHGIISAYDQQSLKGFRELHEKTFGNNLAKKAKIKFGKKKIKQLTDSDYNTYFTTQSAQDTTATLQIDLRKTQKFDVLLLQENIQVGQRVELFDVEYLTPDGQWQPLTQGTTIGYKRLLTFPAVQARHLRLHIRSSRLNPTLSEIGVYKLPEVQGKDRFNLEN